MTTETQTPQTNGTEESATVERTRGGRSYRPSVDIVERPDELVVRADMPGVTAADVDVQFEDGV